MIRFILLILLLVATAARAQEAPVETGDGQSLPTILLSRQLMQQAHVKVGDVVTLATDAEGRRTARFVVAAMYEPTPNPMRFSAKRLEARLHLPDLLALTSDQGDPASEETVSAFNMTIADPGNRAEVDALISKLSARTFGLGIKRAADASGEAEVFDVIDRFHWAIAIVTVFGSTAFLLALMVIRAEERRDIVGILRLMGIPPRSILAEVLIEGLLIAAIGAVFGVIVALAGQVAVNRFFQWRYDTPLRFAHVTVPIVAESIAVALPLGVLAGLVASWTLLRRDVIALIRR